MRKIVIFLSALLLLPSSGVGRTQTAGPQSAQQVVQSGVQPAAYSLPPETLRRAVAYSHARIVLGMVDSVWGIAQLLLILTLGMASWMRDFAASLTRSRWLQCLAFVFQLCLVTTVLELPVEIVGHHLAVAYGQSVQGWASWLGDHGLNFVVGLVLMTPIVMLLFWVIRRSPQRWWLWFWVAVIPIMVAGTWLTPLVYDPLFNRFDPLQKAHPELIAPLEQVVARTGVAIPPERMFLMHASDKVTGINAYVTGFGPSKRFVIWDTSIAQVTPEQLMFIFGHETGHYVLHHIVQGMVFSVVLLLLFFWLGYRTMRWVLARWGGRWQVPSQNDWGALVVLLLVLSCIDFLAAPIENGFSRHIEHAADVYGQEAIHGLVVNPQATAVSAFQHIGESYLEDPAPNPLVEFWMFNHPSVARRAAFAQSYDPWAPGGRPRYFRK